MVNDGTHVVGGKKRRNVRRENGGRKTERRKQGKEGKLSGYDMKRGKQKRREEIMKRRGKKQGKKD